jgi:hypothetical protein
LVPPKKE